MTDDKIRDVLNRYEAHLSLHPEYARRRPWVMHLLTMIPKMRAMLADLNTSLPAIARIIGDTAISGREAEAMVLRYTTGREKLMRWLGFLQGALWVKGIYTIDEMRAHNMPDGKTTAATDDPRVQEFLQKMTEDDPGVH